MVRKSFISACVLVLACVFAVPAMVHAQWQFTETGPGGGEINWGEGNITVVGIGVPPERLMGKPAARPMALRAAELDAYRKLLEVTQGVQVTSDTTVQDFATASDTIRAQVEGMVKGARVLEQRYLSDGTAEVTMRMNMYGRFTDLLLGVAEKKPATTPTAPTTAPQPPTTPAEAAPPVQPVAQPVEPETTAVAKAGVVYTGLVIDARGLSARPCMSPKVLDEDGREVYGSAFVDREWAVQYGMVGYAKDLASAQTNQRVTNNPVTIKGMKATGAAKTNIVISNTSAESLRQASETLAFMQQCRAMFVLD